MIKKSKIIIQMHKNNFSYNKLNQVYTILIIGWLFQNTAIILYFCVYTKQKTPQNLYTINTFAVSKQINKIISAHENNVYYPLNSIHPNICICSGI